MADGDKTDLGEYQATWVQAAKQETGFGVVRGARSRPKAGDQDNDSHDRKRLLSMLKNIPDNAYAVRLLALGERPYIIQEPATRGTLQRLAHFDPPQQGESSRPNGTGRPYAITHLRTLEPFEYRGETYPPAAWCPLVWGKDKENEDQPVDGLGIWSFYPTETPFPTNGLLLALTDYGRRHGVIVVNLGHSWIDTEDGKGRRLIPNALDIGKLADILERQYGWAPTWNDPEPEPVRWEDQLAEGLDVSKPQ